MTRGADPVAVGAVGVAVGCTVNRHRKSVSRQRFADLVAVGAVGLRDKPPENTPLPLSLPNWQRHGQRQRVGDNIGKSTATAATTATNCPPRRAIEATDRQRVNRDLNRWVLPVKRLRRGARSAFFDSSTELGNPAHGLSTRK